MKTQKPSVAWQLSLMSMLSAAAMMAPDFVSATTLDDVMCTVPNWFTGNTGKGLATIAVTVIGIGALLGKVSWGMAIIVGIGVAIIFGAGAIVDAMDGSGGSITACVPSLPTSTTTTGGGAT